MALQLAFAFNGLVIPQAYMRIDRVFGGKTENWNSVVGVYASTDAAAKGQAPFTTFNQPAAYTAGVEPYSLIYAALQAVYPSALSV